LAVYGAVTTNQPAPATCTVDATTTRQKIDGFGAGVVFLDAGLDPLTDAQMDLLYGTSGAQAGLTLLRVRIAPDGNNSGNMLDGQKAYARGARILATPWTPPAAMKDNGSLIQGSVLPAQYGAFVTYLNTYAQYMAANAAPLAFCRDYAGGITAPVMMPESFSYDQTLSDPTLNDPASAANISYIGGHLYGGTIQDYPLAHSLGLHTWMTEYLENDQTIQSAVTTGSQISDCLSVGNMSAYIWWKCIGDANGLLSAAGVPQLRSYVMGQFSRFVRPGDYRVDVPANLGPLGITAFMDAPSGRFAIVVVNNTTLPVPQVFNLQGPVPASLTPYITSATQALEAQAPLAVANSAFIYTIPATSVVTFSGVIPGFATWQQAKFTTAELADPTKSGATAVYGSDGLSNLIKYALGLEPKTNITTGLPGTGVMGTDWVYTYTRPATTTDVTYAVEVSTDLTTWTSSGVTLELVSTSPGSETWRGRYPAASAATLFFRLKVTR
jgi:glucuronoarabinoxylan endo-1,4-beta-xylanase